MKTENSVFIPFALLKYASLKYNETKIGPKIQLNELDEDRRLIRKNLNLAWHELYDHNNNVIEGM